MSFANIVNVLRSRAKGNCARWPSPRSKRSSLTRIHTRSTCGETPSAPVSHGREMKSNARFPIVRLPNGRFAAVFGYLGRSAQVWEFGKKNRTSLVPHINPYLSRTIALQTTIPHCVLCDREDHRPGQGEVCTGGNRSAKPAETVKTWRCRGRGIRTEKRANACAPD